MREEGMRKFGKEAAPPFAIGQRVELNVGESWSKSLWVDGIVVDVPPLGKGRDEFLERLFGTRKVVVNVDSDAPTHAGLSITVYHNFPGSIGRIIPRVECPHCGRSQPAHRRRSKCPYCGEPL
jgi:hypothetical protein